MAATQSLTAVVTDIRKIEMRQFAVSEPAQNDAVLKVKLCGICGSDYDYYVHGEHWPYRKPPQILGHEVVGTIRAIGGEASNSWTLKEGDLVAVEAAISCQRCSGVSPHVATHTVCFEDGPLDKQIKKILGPDMADVVEVLP